MYGWGHNETLLGKALKGRRDKAIVATKFGQTKGADGKQGVDGSPDYVQQACEASLKRLGIDVIDLYYQHRVDPNTPIEDTVGAMKRLVEQGKVRALGLSEAAPDTIRRAHKVHPIAAVQNEYSLLYRKDGEETLRACRELGISLVAYAPLGRSMLTGTVHGKADLPEGDRRLAHPRFQGEALEKNVTLVVEARGHRAGEEVHARRSWCSPGCWRRARTSCRSPAPSARSASTRTSLRFDIKLSAEDIEENLRRRPGRRRRRHALSRGRDEARLPVGVRELRRRAVAAARHPLVAAVPLPAHRGAGLRHRRRGRGARALRRAVPGALGDVRRAPADRPVRALAGPPRRSALVNNVLPFVCLAWAATVLPAGYLAIINGMVPLWTALFAAPAAEGAARRAAHRRLRARHRRRGADRQPRAGRSSTRTPSLAALRRRRRRGVLGLGRRDHQAALGQPAADGPRRRLDRLGRGADGAGLGRRRRRRTRGRSRRPPPWSRSARCAAASPTCPSSP